MIVDEVGRCDQVACRLNGLSRECYSHRSRGTSRSVSHSMSQKDWSHLSKGGRKALHNVKKRLNVLSSKVSGVTSTALLCYWEDGQVGDGWVTGKCVPRKRRNAFIYADSNQSDSVTLSKCYAPENMSQSLAGATFADVTDQRGLSTWTWLFWAFISL